MTSSKQRRKKRRPRTAPPANAAAPGKPAPKPRPRREPDAPPPAPWGSFPLVELATLIALLMLIAGFFFVGGDRGAVMITAGLVIGSLAGLELAVREHFAGYRSHTMLLAGVPAVATMGILVYLGPDSLGTLLRIGIAAAVFAGVGLLLTGVFRSRSGGYAYKIRGFGR